VEPGILAGPWETAYGSGQVGIHIVIHTTMWKSVESGESLAVQVYILTSAPGRAHSPHGTARQRRFAWSGLGRWTMSLEVR
jgi:hypothetical protein